MDAKSSHHQNPIEKRFQEDSVVSELRQMVSHGGGRWYECGSCSDSSGTWVLENTEMGHAELKSTYT